VTIRTGRTLKDGKLADVPIKTVIQVKLDETKKIVQSIEVSISITVHGSVSQIDDKSITLSSGRDESKSATYTLSKDVKVHYQLPASGENRRTPGEVKTLKLADVIVKASVALQLDDELKVVQSIEVQLPSVRGTLREVDAKKGTLV